MQTAVVERFPPPIKPVNFTVDQKQKFVKFSRNDNYGNYGIAGVRRRTIAQGKTMQWPRQMTQSNGVVFAQGMNSGYKPPINFQKIDKSIPTSGRGMRIVSSGGPEIDGDVLSSSTSKIRSLIAVVRVKLIQLQINIGNVLRIGGGAVDNGPQPGNLNDARAILDGLRQLIQPIGLQQGAQAPAAQPHSAGPNAETAQRVINIAQQAVDQAAAGEEVGMDVDPVEAAIAEISNIEPPVEAQQRVQIQRPPLLPGIAQENMVNFPEAQMAVVNPPAVAAAGVPPIIQRGQRRGREEDDDGSGGGMEAPTTRRQRLMGDDDQNNDMVIDDVAVTNVQQNRQRRQRRRRRQQMQQARLGRDALPIFDANGNYIDRSVHVAGESYEGDPRDDPDVVKEIGRHQPRYQPAPAYSGESMIQPPVAAYPAKLNPLIRRNDKRPASQDFGPRKHARNDDRAEEGNMSPGAGPSQVQKHRRHLKKHVVTAQVAPGKRGIEGQGQRQPSKKLRMTEEAAEQQEHAATSTTSMVEVSPTTKSKWATMSVEELRAKGLSRKQIEKVQKLSKKKKLSADDKAFLHGLGLRRSSVSEGKNNDTFRQGESSKGLRGGGGKR